VEEQDILREALPHNIDQEGGNKVGRGPNGTASSDRKILRDERRGRLQKYRLEFMHSGDLFIILRASIYDFMLGFGRVRQALCISLKMEKIREAYRGFGWTSKEESCVEIMWEVGGAVMV